MLGCMAETVRAVWSGGGGAPKRLSGSEPAETEYVMGPVGGGPGGGTVPPLSGCLLQRQQALEQALLFCDPWGRGLRHPWWRGLLGLEDGGDL